MPVPPYLLGGKFAASFFFHFKPAWLWYHAGISEAFLKAVAASQFDTYP